MHVFQSIGYPSSRISFKVVWYASNGTPSSTFVSARLTMGAMYILYSLVYFGVSYAALIVPDNILLQPLNISTTEITLGNHTLGGWPPRGAWTPLGGDLFIHWLFLGDYAPQNQWNNIRVAFDDIKNRIENYPYWSTSRLLTYRSGYVVAEMTHLYERGRDQISAVEAAKVVKAIRDFIVIFGYKPRELTVSLRKARSVRMILYFRWQRDVSHEWPMDLPFDVSPVSDKKMLVYLYGRDAEPSSIDGIRVTLSKLVYGLGKKQETWHEMKHYTYSNEYVKLIAEGVVSGDTKDRMTWGDLETITGYGIFDSYSAKGFGPRELAVRCMKLHGQDWREVGKVFIYFTDLDSTERAIEWSVYQHIVHWHVSGDIFGKFHLLSHQSTSYSHCTIQIKERRRKNLGVLWAEVEIL